jgi:hypothetical protein
VYGRHDRVINDLRALAARYQDTSVRRALCAAIVAKSNHRWSTIDQADLRIIVSMMGNNIKSTDVKEGDLRRWLGAYCRLGDFNVEFVRNRLVDWHNLYFRSVYPAYYLYVFYFLRWLTAPAPREGFATELNEWLRKCQANRPLGERAWSFDWLGFEQGGLRNTGFIISKSSILIHPAWYGEPIDPIVENWIHVCLRYLVYCAIIADLRMRFWTWALGESAHTLKAGAFPLGHEAALPSNYRDLARCHGY